MSSLFDTSEPSPLQGIRDWLSREPDTTYGSILPFKLKAGEDVPKLSLPEALRSPALGLLDLMEQKTGPGGLTPDSINTLLTLTNPAAGPSSPGGMFMGARALTAPTARIPKAEAMVARGVDPNAVRKLTGWFLGPDGEWRWELADNKARMKTEAFEPYEYDTKNEGRLGLPRMASPPEIEVPHPTRSGETYKIQDHGNTGLKLPDVLDHPALFKAYPELADLQIRHIPGFNFGLQGAMDAPNKKLYLANGLEPEKAMGTILHEVQHYIQNKEDFASGSSPSVFLPPWYTQESAHKAWKDYDTSLSKISEDHGINRYDLSYALGLPEDKLAKPAYKTQKDLLEKAETHPEYPALLQNALEYERHNAAKDEASDAYWRMFGEVEARGTEKRRSLNPSERQSLSPIEMLNTMVPVEKQLVFKKGDLSYNEPTASFDAYHGSPYQFDRFKDEAVGSGEGHQSFGWGHYVAGNPETAKSYQQRLSPGKEVLLGDTPLEQSGEAIPKFAREALLQTKDPDAALRVINRWGQYEGNLMNHGPGAFADAEEWVRKNAPRLSTRDRGELYNVKVKPEEHELLNWDKPLDQQSPQVKAKLKELPKNIWDSIDSNLDERNMNLMSENPDAYTGRHLYQALKHYDVHESLPVEVPGSSWMTGNTTEEKHVSRYLHSIGIPGIKYLDQGSRAKGEGTHNYVIFDPSNLEITHRNGTRLKPTEPGFKPDFGEGK